MVPQARYTRCWLQPGGGTHTAATIVSISATTSGDQSRRDHQSLRQNDLRGHRLTLALGKRCVLSISREINWCAAENIARKSRVAPRLGSFRSSNVCLNKVLVSGSGTPPKFDATSPIVSLTPQSYSLQNQSWSHTAVLDAFRITPRPMDGLPALKAEPEAKHRGKSWKKYI